MRARHIPGLLDYAALARLNPIVPASKREVVRDLAAHGLAVEDIAVALTIAPDAVRALLAADPAVYPDRP